MQNKTENTSRMSVFERATENKIKKLTLSSSTVSCDQCFLPYTLHHSELLSQVLTPTDIFMPMIYTFRCLYPIQTWISEDLSFDSIRCTSAFYLIHYTTQSYYLQFWHQPTSLCRWYTHLDVCIRYRHEYLKTYHPIFTFNMVGCIKRIYLSK